MIVVIVRTRNEHANIKRFCKSYQWADKILIADGGSEDDTLEIADKFPNTIHRHYTKRVELRNGYWRNNDSDHTNFLIAWTKELNLTKYDWVISDDCDIAPNYLLRQDAKSIMESSTADYLMVVRLYLWKFNQHFPWMAKPEPNHGYYEPSLWAWRGDQDLWTVDVPPAFTFRVGDNPIVDFRYDVNSYRLMTPYCLLHYGWVNPERLEKKLKTYRESGLIPDMQHPLNFAGPLEVLPNWAHI